jgi:hypothetical protein
LPAGLRPHVTEHGTVIGSCLLDLGDVRPSPLSPALGPRVRAAAHRISVEWTDVHGETTVGVYVPIRHTDAPLARLLGDRLFPGVHAAAAVELTDDGHRLGWSVRPCDDASPFAIRVRAEITASSAAEPREPIGGTCLAATIGLSPRRRGQLDGVRMEPEHRRAHAVVIEEIESAFLTSFTSTVPAASYLMRDVAVVWTPAPTALLLADRVSA